MKKAIIILSSIIVILITSFILTIFIQKKVESKLINDNKEKLIELEVELNNRESTIQDLKDNPIIITKEILKEVSCDEKDDLILDLKDQNETLKKIVDDDTIIIHDLKDKLEKTNNKLAKRFIPKHSIGLIGLAGIDNTLDIDIYAGVNYKRYFWEGRFYLGVGGAIKPYKDIGGAITFEIGFSF